MANERRCALGQTPMEGGGPCSKGQWKEVGLAPKAIELSGARAARALYFTQFPPRLYMLCHHSDAHAAFVLHAADG